MTWERLRKVGSAVAGHNPRLGVRFSRVAIPHTFERRYNAFYGTPQNVTDGPGW
jgi:hypothetical protein